MIASSAACTTAVWPSPPKRSCATGGRDALVGPVDLDELEDRAEDLAREREVVADAARARRRAAACSRGSRSRPGAASVAGDCDTASTFEGPRPPCGKQQRVSCDSAGRRRKSAPLALHRGAQRGGDRAVDDRRLLGGAGRAPVEDLGGHDAARGEVEVAHRGVDVGRHVARADGVGRLAGGVGREHHRARSRGEHEVGAVVAHERVGAGHRDARHRLDEVGRRARLLTAASCMTARGLAARADGARVRREDDGVARLGRDQRLEEHRRGRVRDRHETGDHADRLGDLDHALAVSFSITPTVRSSLEALVDRTAC